MAEPKEQDDKPAGILNLLAYLTTKNNFASGMITACVCGTIGFWIIGRPILDSRDKDREASMVIVSSLREAISELREISMKNDRSSERAKEAAASSEASARYAKELAESALRVRDGRP